MPAATTATAAYEASQARVRLNLSGFASGTTAVQVTRKDLTTGRTDLVRGARNIAIVTPASDTVQLYDYESTPGHRVQYGYFQFPDTTRYVVKAEKLSADDSGFETSAGGWANSNNANVTRQTTQARTGVASLRLEALAAGDMEAKLVAAGGSGSDFTADPVSYVIGFGAKAGVTSRTTQLVVNCYNSAGVYLTSLVVAQSDNAAGWSFASSTVLAPGGTVRWEAFLQVFGAANTERHYFDDLTISPVDGIAVHDVDSVWIKSLTRPYLSRRVKVATFTPYEHVVRGTVTPAVRRSIPVGGGDVRGGRRFTVSLKLDASQRDDLDDLLAVGGIWLWQIPGADVGLPRSGYVQCTRAQERQRGPAQSGQRWLDLTLEETGPPDADVVAAAASWDNVKATYATWNDFAAAAPAWNDALAAVADPAEVVVV